MGGLLFATTRYGRRVNYLARPVRGLSAGRQGETVGMVSDVKDVIGEGVRCGGSHFPGSTWLPRGEKHHREEADRTTPECPPNTEPSYSRFGRQEPGSAHRNVALSLIQLVACMQKHGSKCPIRGPASPRSYRPKKEYVEGDDH